MGFLFVPVLLVLRAAVEHLTSSARKSYWHQRDGGKVFSVRPLISQHQFMNVSNTSLMHAKVNYGVPPGSIPGPVIFTLGMLNAEKGRLFSTFQLYPH